MPTRCIVAGCSNTTKEDVSLHKFPKDVTLRKIWTSKVKLTRGNWKGPTDTSVICSAHFETSDFEEGLWAQFGLKIQRRLKPDAIPRNIRCNNDEAKNTNQRKQHRPAAEKRKRMRVRSMLLLCFSSRSSQVENVSMVGLRI